MIEFERIIDRWMVTVRSGDHTTSKIANTKDTALDGAMRDIGHAETLGMTLRPVSTQIEVFPV